MTTFEMLRPGLPPGRHVVVFEGTTEVEPKDTRFDRRAMRFTFVCEEGEHEGHIATRQTGLRARKSNVLGKTLNELNGESIPARSSVDTDDFVGRKYAILIEEVKADGDEGRDGNATTRIAEIKPYQDGDVIDFDKEE